MQQQQQQQERSWREQICSFVSPAGASWFGNIAGRGGATGLVKVVNLFLRWIHFSIKALFLVEYDVYFFTARVKNREIIGGLFAVRVKTRR